MAALPIPAEDRGGHAAAPKGPYRRRVQDDVQEPLYEYDQPQRRSQARDCSRIRAQEYWRQIPDKSQFVIWLRVPFPNGAVRAKVRTGSVRRGATSKSQFAGASA